MHLSFSNVYLLVSLLLLLVSLYAFKYSEQGPRERFEAKFKNTCSKYPFVQRFEEILGKPKHDIQDYVVYAFSEKYMGKNGGLGDRIGGLISAVAFAIRTNRTLLISGDRSFEELFQPYQRDIVDKSRIFDWKSWEWANWDRKYSWNMTFNGGCVNPRPRNVNCALDTEGKVPYENYKVVKHRGNRAYLCRWGIKESLGLQDEMKQVFGIDISTDLYEVAGCLMRLVLWPRQEMWDALDEWISSLEGSNQIGTLPSKITKQIGFHFRCGDTSFDSANTEFPLELLRKGNVLKRLRNPSFHNHKRYRKILESFNRECIFDTKESWNGTTFADDLSLDSPIDEATCGRKLLEENNNNDETIVYIASDNPSSAMQINATLDWKQSIIPTQVCHVEQQYGNIKCSMMTYIQWFMLSLSDYIVMQGLLVNDAVPSPYHAASDPTRQIDRMMSRYAKQGPISAFSRYAAIYGLSEDILRYGLDCRSVNKTALSWQTQGNWLCDAKFFH